MHGAYEHVDCPGVGQVARGLRTGKGWCPWYEGGVRWPCTAAAAESSGKFILPGGLMFGHHSMWARTPPNPPAMASSKTRARSIRWRPASPCTPRHLRCILGPGQTHAGDGTHGGPQTTPATNTFRHCLHAYLLFLLLWHFLSSHITCDAPTRTAVPYDTEFRIQIRKIVRYEV